MNADSSEVTETRGITGSYRSAQLRILLHSLPSFHGRVPSAFRGSRGLAASQISRRRPLFMQLGKYAFPRRDGGFSWARRHPGRRRDGGRFGEAFCRGCTVRKGCESAARERLGAVFARVERLQRSGGERPHQRWEGEGRTLPTALGATLCEGAPIPWSGRAAAALGSHACGEPIACHGSLRAHHQQ
jgi:hypothetical protein